MTRWTSVNTYNKIKNEGLVGKLQFEVYDLVYKHGPITQKEVILKTGRWASERSITPRFAELMRLGIVTTHDTRPCKVSGHEVYTWVTTDNLPVKPTKKTRPASIRRENEACALIADEFNYKTIAAKIRERMT